MPHSHAQRAAIIRRNTSITIAQNLSNVASKIRILRQQGVAENNGEMIAYKKIRNKLVNELERFINKRFAALENHTNIDAIISDLDKKSEQAKQESNRLKDTAKKLNDFNKMLANITKIVTSLVAIAV